MTEMTALGYCPQCREMLVDVNGQKKCLACTKSPRPSHLGPKPAAVGEVPDTAEARKLLGDYKNAKTSKKEEKQELLRGNAEDALQIMKNLPIPENEKEFKQIRKIIKELEKLVGAK